MHRNKLLNLLTEYSTDDLDELKMKQKIVEFIKSTPHCFENTYPTGHITASAWIVDFDKRMVGLVHHKKLNKWLQPGGHSDGRYDTSREALREAREEFGIAELRLRDEKIFNVDIHIIPEDRKRNLGEHLHYDIRFLVEADSSMKPTQSHESHEVKWVALDEIKSLNNARNIMRMVEKTYRYLHEPG